MLFNEFTEGFYLMLSCGVVFLPVASVVTFFKRAVSA